MKALEKAARTSLRSQPADEAKRKLVSATKGQPDEPFMAAAFKVTHSVRKRIPLRYHSIPSW